MPVRVTNPLVEYENLIQNGGIDKCYEDFLDDREVVDGKFTSGARDSFAVHEQDQYGNWLVFEDSFKKRLNTAFNIAHISTIKALSDQLGSIISSEDLKSRLIGHLDAIHFLYQLVPMINTYNSGELIGVWLVRLISFLYEKHISLRVYHPAFDLLSSLPESDFIGGFFGFDSTIKKLYSLFELLCHLNLFSEENTRAGDFVNVFRSDSPESTGIKLKFACTSEKAAWIIQQMIPLFKNLTDKALEESNCFQTKGGHNLKQANLHAARSKYKNDLSKDEERQIIERAILNFRKHKG